MTHTDSNAGKSPPGPNGKKAKKQNKPAGASNGAASPSKQDEIEIESEDDSLEQTAAHTISSAMKIIVEQCKKDK